ncbi:uncharacterized protein CANTADRAFT_87480 [Suhomyces tanzawaensis NRRL Y-17324]|uniref:Pre-mRNA-splicing factor CWC25 n=1 Tax=Suhomyces tanzawaensis NRRL Y-17324 TaxID=984487 RepID=A0A1E4SPN2_9ASCO|nr:uncharacterized protein CANTADRAFT_87480 [Suhomyces tanzawaensis NRRL Y-17324]ODV81455.1 hypothetical protein CANTADRAFT_87480 [Suhomyces tanzawaensis NRRL Y-17324]
MAGDLNLKKSWNPALVKNQTKVWEEEQAKLAELKKIRERNEELAKEQEYLNLLKLQHGDDFNNDDLSKTEKLKLNKLNWMYEDVPHSSKNEAGFIERSDEFVEGKEKVEGMLKGNRSFRRNDGDSISRIVGVGKQKSSAVIEDDPLMKIRSARSTMVTRDARERSPDRSRDQDKHRSDRHRHRDGHRHRHKHRSDTERDSRKDRGLDSRKQDSRKHGDKEHRDKHTHRSNSERDNSHKRNSAEKSSPKELDTSSRAPQVALLY